MSNYYNTNSGDQKDLPPVPPKQYGHDFSPQGGYDGYNRSGQNQVRNIIQDDDFDFVDPNAHIDNSFKDSTFRPANPNLSLNNRIIYDYDTDGDSDFAGPSQSQQFSSNHNGNNDNHRGTDQRQLAAGQQQHSSNSFYSQSNKSDHSRESSTKSNPFKEDPFNEYNPKRGSRNTRPFSEQHVNDPNNSFDNVPIRSVAYNQTPSFGNSNNFEEGGNAATSLLNPYRNNKFYNNESRTINGGFRVNDEFAPNELRPRFIADPGNDTKPKGFLVFKGKKVPIVSYIFTIIQIVVFIAELAKMGLYTGNPVQTKPYFNPMIGPSSYLQINMGSRFVPCMIQVEGITNNTDNVFPCPNSTDSSTGCPLDYLCGLSGLDKDSDGYKPSQWYRIVTPIFLHAGFIHIICNMLLQVMLGVDMERQIGSIIFLVIYMAAGISGNIFGANFAQNGLSSTGASGSLFGIIGVNLVHFLFFTNRTQMHPRVYRKNLFYLIFEIIFTLILGLLPGLDNFSHIGGFVAGCLLSVVLLKDPNFVFQERYRYLRDPTELNKSAIPARSSLNSFTPFDYDGSNAAGANGISNTSNIRVINSKFARFLPNVNIRKPVIFAIWVIARLVAGLLVFLWFYFLSVNFFRDGGGHCSWCQYFSCIPIKDWCTMGKIELENLSTTNNTSLLILNVFVLFLASHFKIISSRIYGKKVIKTD